MGVMGLMGSWAHGLMGSQLLCVCEPMSLPRTAARYPLPAPCYPHFPSAMKLYLVGFMGSGKTTIGRELAMRIDAPFFDLDDLIESSEKMSIRELLDRKSTRLNSSH